MGKATREKQRDTQTSLKLNKFQEPLVLAKEVGKVPFEFHPLGDGKQVLSKEVSNLYFKTMTLEAMH